MVARTWKGVVRSEDAEEYVGYVEETGVAAYRTTAGNQGAWILTRDLGDGRTEIVTFSLWDSRDAIRAFAGDDLEQAVLYPEDARWLLEHDDRVVHHDVAG
jgi:heme-degrading monooxygenase HmoA